MTRVAVATLALFVTAISVQAADIDFQVTPLGGGEYEVAVEVSGADTSGLSSYSITVVGLDDPLSATWTETRLGNVDLGTFMPQGFTGDPLRANFATSMNVGHSQFNGNPVYGIGMQELNVPGGPAPVVLGVPAVLGTLGGLPDDLTVDAFEVNAGAFDETQTKDAGLGADAKNITVSLIPEPATMALLGIGALALIRKR